MSGTNQKRCRKSKLVPRSFKDCDDDSDNNSQDDPPKRSRILKDSSRITTIQDQPSTSNYEPLQFDIKIEVEECDEFETAEILPTSDIKTEIINENDLFEVEEQEINLLLTQMTKKSTKLNKSYNDSQGHLSAFELDHNYSPKQSPMPSVYSHLKLDEDIILKALDDLCKNSTMSLADNILAAEMRNLWGRCRTIDCFQTEIEKSIQIAINTFKYWKHTTKGGEVPLMYKCYVCEKAWWHLGPFEEHVLTHNEELRVESESQKLTLQYNIVAYSAQSSLVYKDFKIDSNCWRCGYGFDHHVNYEKINLCEHCSQTFSNCIKYRSHEALCVRRLKALVKSGPIVVFNCHICDLKVLNKEVLKNHYLEYHSVRSDMPVFVDIRNCTTCYKNYSSLPLHYCKRKNHSSMCQYCAKKFPSKVALDIHLQEESNYPCAICHYKLPKKCMLADHMLKHSNKFIMLYKCLSCQDNVLLLDANSVRQHKVIWHKQKIDKRRHYFDMVLAPRDFIEQQKASLLVSYEMMPSVKKERLLDQKELETAVQMIEVKEENEMEKRSARVSEAQWSILMEFLESNPSLARARGYNNSAQGRAQSLRLWQNVSTLLNAEGSGTSKSPKEWSIYVSNYKSKLKKLVADINMDTTATGGGPPRANTLSELDQRFLALLGPGFGQSASQVLVLPFPDQQPFASASTTTEPELLMQLVDETRYEEENANVREYPLEEVEETLAPAEGEETLAPARVMTPRPMPTETNEPLLPRRSRQKRQRNSQEIDFERNLPSTSIFIKQEDEDFETFFEEKMIKEMQKTEIFTDDDEGYEYLLSSVFNSSNCSILNNQIAEVTDEFEDIINRELKKKSKKQSKNSKKAKDDSMTVIFDNGDNGVNLEVVSTVEQVDDKKAKKTLKCEYQECEYECVDKEELKVHRQSHRMVVMMSCSKCNEGFNSLRRYLDHLTDHDLMKWTCPECLKRYTSFSGIAAHIRVAAYRSFDKKQFVDKDRDKISVNYQCTKCGQSVERRALLDHWETHIEWNDSPIVKVEITEEDGEVDVDGIHCDTTEDQQDEDMTPEVMQRVIASLVDSSQRCHPFHKMCLACGRSFERRNDCKRHHIEHLLANAYVTKVLYEGLRCQICYSTFERADAYKQHMRDHGHLPVHKCDLCFKTFSDSSNYVKHKKTHSSMYICDICKKKFIAKDSIIKHMQCHSNTEPIHCMFCRKVAYSDADFSRHIRSAHNQNLFKYTCIICKKRFKTTKDKWDHMWMVHKERAIKADCPLCNAEFRKLSDVKSHLRTLHNQETSVMNAKVFNELLKSVKQANNATLKIIELNIHPFVVVRSEKYSKQFQILKLDDILSMIKTVRDKE